MTVSAQPVVMAFEPEGIEVPISAILPVKQLPASIKTSRKYVQIAASIAEVGIIEPPVVARGADGSGVFLLVDGYIRIEILKDLGASSVTCLVAIDDEAFTYNKRISRLATVQEHKMILRAVERGVSEERIAKALDVNVENIRMKRKLLDGICPEVAELLKDKHCPLNTFHALRKMKAMRQVEAVELMIAMNNYTVPYAEALLAATSTADLVSPAKKKEIKGLSAEQVERMQSEMASLQRKVKLIEGSYGPDQLKLVVACRYIETLLGNPKLARYLTQHHQDILKEFQQIVDVTIRQPASAHAEELENA